MGNIRKNRKLRLSRVIPAHTVTTEFYDVGIDYATMCQKWRNARSRMADPLDTCFWCGHKFEDGEKMSLGLSVSGNKMLCRKCADLVEVPCVHPPDLPMKRPVPYTQIIEGISWPTYAAGEVDLYIASLLQAVQECGKLAVSIECDSLEPDKVYILAGRIKQACHPWLENESLNDMKRPEKLKIESGYSALAESHMDAQARDIKALKESVLRGEIESENEAYETAARLCDEKAQELHEWNKMNLAKWASDQAQAFEEMAREIRDYKFDAALTEGERDEPVLE